MEPKEKDLVKEQFGRNAEAYVKSRSHSQGSDLGKILDWARPSDSWKCLDIATGGGHVARTLSPHVSLVVAADITMEMLQAARRSLEEAGAENVIYVIADAENLPFLSEAFHLVTCRIAPHHFKEKAQFLQQASRVLMHGGTFVMIDNVAPEDPVLDNDMNTFEKLRDQSHVRCSTISQWKKMLNGAGFSIIREETVRKTYEFKEWAARTARNGEQIEQVKEYILSMDEKSRRYFSVKISGGDLISLEVDQWMVMAVKP